MDGVAARVGAGERLTGLASRGRRAVGRIRSVNNSAGELPSHPALPAHLTAFALVPVRRDQFLLSGSVCRAGG
jgi:hypothetical protein